MTKNPNNTDNSLESNFPKSNKNPTILADVEEKESEKQKIIPNQQVNPKPNKHQINETLKSDANFNKIKPKPQKQINKKQGNSLQHKERKVIKKLPKKSLNHLSFDKPNQEKKHESFNNRNEEKHKNIYDNENDGFGDEDDDQFLDIDHPMVSLPPVDIMLLVDASNSIGNRNFEQVIKK